MEKLGSIPRTPTLRVLAAQQDLAFCFVCVKCWELMLCFFFGICCEFCLRPVGELVAGQTAMGKEECQWALTDGEQSAGSSHGRPTPGIAASSCP